MFHHSYRLNESPQEISPPPRYPTRKKTLAKRLEEQERELQLLSLEELPHGPQVSNNDEGSDRHDSCPHHMLDDQEEDVDNANESFNSCPARLSAIGRLAQEDGGSLDSPMTHPPLTVVVRASDPRVATPRTKNSMDRKKLFSFEDFSTICSDNGETSECAADKEDLSLKEDTTVAAVAAADANLNRDESEIKSCATAATYPPTTIMFVPNSSIDTIATPCRRTHRLSYSDLSNSMCSHLQQFPALPNLDKEDDDCELLSNSDIEDETEEDDDQIPHVMFSPFVVTDDDDDDDTDDFLYAEINGIHDHFALCQGRMIAEGSIAL